MNQILWICLLLAVTGCKTYHATPVAIAGLIDSKTFLEMNGGDMAKKWFVIQFNIYSTIDRNGPNSYLFF